MMKRKLIDIGWGLLFAIAPVAFFLLLSLPLSRADITPPALPPNLLVYTKAMLVDCNVIGDNIVPMPPSGLWHLNASIELAVSGAWSTAQVAVYTGAGATGTALTGPYVISGLTTSTANTVGNMQLNPGINTIVMSGTPNLYFRVITPQGAACQINVLFNFYKAN